MRWGVLGLGVVLALAACQDAGVEIIVYPSTDPAAAAVDEIRLYVGYGEGEDGPFGSKGFAPNPDRPARSWLEDTDVPYEYQRLSSPDQVAHFVFEARGEGDRIAVVAVGMTTGRPTSVISRIDIRIPNDKVAIYRLGLNPAADPVNAAVTNLSTVQLWGGADGQSCVWLRTSHPGNRLPTNPDLHDVYIGLYDDGDCDSYKRDDTVKECDDHWFEASTVPSASTLSCMKDDSIPVCGAPSPLCVFGGLQCKDGGTGAVACSTARPYCAGLTLCAACNEDDPVAQFRCAIDPERHNAPVAAVCPVAAQRQPDGTYQICAQNIVLQTVTGLACTGAPTFHGPAVGQPWTPAIPLFGARLDFAPLTAGNSCSVTMHPRLVGEPFQAMQLPSGGLIARTLPDGHGLVMPVQFVLEETTCEPIVLPRSCTTQPDAASDLQSCLASTAVSL